MAKIIITTFDDGYVLTHNEDDFKYRGKQDDTIKMISVKIEEILKKERNKMIQDILNGNVK